MLLVSVAVLLNSQISTSAVKTGMGVVNSASTTRAPSSAAATLATSSTRMAKHVMVSLHSLDIGLTEPLPALPCLSLPSRTSLYLVLLYLDYPVFPYLAILYLIATPPPLLPCLVLPNLFLTLYCFTLPYHVLSYHALLYSTLLCLRFF